MNCAPCMRQLADGSTIPVQVTLQFRSTPAGADVIVDQVKIGVTPLSATVSTDRQHEFLLQKAGYVTARYAFAPASPGYIWAKLVKPGPSVTADAGVAKFTTDEPTLGGFPATTIVLGVLGLGLVGYVTYRVFKAR